jgi:hypothetical protein
MHIEDHMEDMQRYRDFRPTAFDCRGLGCEDQQDWIVGPVTITRDTPEHSCDASNWHVILTALEKLDDEGSTWEVHRFGHWGPGWFEIVLARPDSAAHRLLAECMCALANYAVLSDEDHSEREFEAMCEAWEQADLRDRIYYLNKARQSIFAARRDELPSDDTGALREALLSC